MDSNVHWAKTRDSDALSWHIVEKVTVMPGVTEAFCGKRLTTPPVDNRTEGKTCESCLRHAGPR